MILQIKKQNQKILQPLGFKDLLKKILADTAIKKIFEEALLHSSK